MPTKREPRILLVASYIARIATGCAPSNAIDAAAAKSKDSAASKEAQLKIENESPPRAKGDSMANERAAIDGWWNEFTSRTKDLDDLFSRKTKWDLPQWMETHLQGINPNLMWEFGPSIRAKGHRLVITPESHRELRPLVKRILDRAPKLDSWEFYTYRLPESFDQTELTVKGRTGATVVDVSFTATINDLNRIDLVFYSARYSSADDRQARKDVFVATETLLGEEILDKWIGGIDVDRLSKDIHQPVSIKELKATVDGMITGARQRLPQVPNAKLPDGQQWSLFKLTPKKADEYPRQLDMFVGRTTIVPMWQNAHRDVPFDSVRFSAVGEVFCYIKLDGTQGLDGEKFKDKAEIEDAVDGTLKKAAAGCVVGGGTGLRYSYIDLALVDVTRATEEIKRILRAGNIAKRSWLLFFDTDLEAEWIGICDDTPPPPLRKFSAEK